MVQDRFIKMVSDLWDERSRALWQRPNFSALPALRRLRYTVIPEDPHQDIYKSARRAQLAKARRLAFFKLAEAEAFFQDDSFTRGMLYALRRCGWGFCTQQGDSVASTCDLHGPLGSSKLGSGTI